MVSPFGALSVPSGPSRTGFFKALNGKLHDNHAHFDIALMMGDFNFVEDPLADRLSVSDNCAEQGLLEFQIAAALLEVKDLYIDLLSLREGTFLTFLGSMKPSPVLTGFMEVMLLSIV